MGLRSTPQVLQQVNDGAESVQQSPERPQLQLDPGRGAAGRQSPGSCESWELLVPWRKSTAVLGMWHRIPQKTSC